METALYILHVIVCIAMLPIILLQSGKGGGVRTHCKWNGKPLQMEWEEGI